VVPILADIDAGFGNAEATYLLAQKMIEAGACALQPTTVVDLSGAEPEIIRQGAGDPARLGL
jgi:tRNA A37 threonylcarbamoyladenosine synthetase subunit TsaC/SUA5/YrdC